MLITVIFGWISYIGVRKAAFQVGQERLIAIIDQLTSQYPSSTRTMITATRVAAGQPAVKKFLASSGLDSAAAVQKLLEKMREDSSYVQVDLLNAAGQKLLHSAKKGIDLNIPIDSLLPAAAPLMPDSGKIGKLYALHHSVYYPIVVPVANKMARSNSKIIGYVVRWRSMKATPQALDQLSKLLGAGAKLYIGNTDGSLWTDLVSVIATPPISKETKEKVITYSPKDRAPVLAAIRPLPNTPWQLSVELSQRRILESARLFLLWIIVSGLVLLVIGTAAVWLMSNSITKPLKDLTDAVAALASGQNSRLASYQGYAELGKLSHAFNKLLNQLEKAASANLEKEKQYRFLLQNMREGIAVLDPDLRYLFVNHALAEQAKRPIEELVGRTIMEIFPGFEKTAIYSRLKKVLAAQEVQFLENEFLFPDGKKEWFELSLQPVPEGVLLHSVNITQRKRSEHALQESLHEIWAYKNALQSQSEALSRSNLILELDPEGIILTANDNFLQLFGYSLNELKQQQHSLLVKEEEQQSDAYRQFWTQLKNGVFQMGEFERKTKNGQSVWIHGSYNPIYDQEGRLIKVLKIATDITAQKQVETKLKQSEQEHRYLFENNPLPMWMFTIDDLKFVEVNHAALQHYGYSKNEFLQMSIQDIRPAEDRQKIKELVQQHESGPRHGGYWRHLKKDGSLIYVNIISHDMHFKDKLVRLVLAIDFTEKFLADAQLKKYADDLKASNTELERFAYVASHDLQEPLRMVSSFMGLLEKKYASSFDDTARSYIRFAVDGAERMKRLIQDLLLFSRVDAQKEPMVAVNCNQLVAQMRQDLLKLTVERKATIQAMPLPVVKGYRTQLQQLFQNLVSNALKYASEKPPLIEIGCVENETHWQFFVKDNGIGIDPKYFEKIFVLFQRLHNKDDFSGTGIGLTVAKKIVERHGGKIWIESEPGCGSVFYFTLDKGGK